MGDHTQLKKYILKQAHESNQVESHQSTSSLLSSFCKLLSLRLSGTSLNSSLDAQTSAHFLFPPINTCRSGIRASLGRRFSSTPV